MIRKRYIIILVALLVVLFPVYANQTGTKGVLNGKDAEFTIKAYKSNPGGTNPTTIVSVYDALTGTLNELGKDAGKIDHINIEDYLQNFLSSSTPDPKTDKQHVLFSYFVTGSETGKYTLTINIGNFVGPYESLTSSNLNGAKSEMPAYFKFGFTETLFPSNHSNQSGTIEINKPVYNYSTYTKTPFTDMTVSWDFKKTGKLSESWLSEGVILMYIAESDYKAAPAGSYRATVSVTLTYGG